MSAMGAMGAFLSILGFWAVGSGQWAVQLSCPALPTKFNVQLFWAGQFWAVFAQF